jgi:transcription initiation factor IIE alpha subunit
MNSSHSRGFGELGSTKRDMNFKKASLDDELSDESSSEEELKREGELITCPNCNKQMSCQEAPTHTVQCLRNSTKCKVCGEVILKDKKKEHLSRWRNTDNLLKAICEDIEEQVSLHFDHGMNCNMQFDCDS